MQDVVSAVRARKAALHFGHAHSSYAAGKRLWRQLCGASVSSSNSDKMDVNNSGLLGSWGAARSSQSEPRSSQGKARGSIDNAALPVRGYQGQRDTTNKSDKADVPNKAFAVPSNKSNSGSRARLMEL
jgi:hypothetical protein